MPLEFRFQPFTFDPTKDNPHISDPVTFSFPGQRVLNVLVAISSFKFQYSTSNGEIADHHLGVAEIDTVVDIAPAEDAVVLQVRAFLLRDASPDPDKAPDDFYEGSVNVQLLVETA